MLNHAHELQNTPGESDSTGFGIRARLGDVDPVRELPYGPAALCPRKQAGQMAASDYRQYPILLLHLLGRPQMECGRR